MKNLQQAGCFVLMLIFLIALAQPSTQTPAEPWQRLEYVCADDFSVSQLSVSPEHVTLIVENTFYPMKQVASDEAVTLRFESASEAGLVWLVKKDGARLFQDGQVLGDGCIPEIVPPQTAQYHCNDAIEVSVQYVNDTALIDVRDPTYGDQRYELPKTFSDTGSRFSNGMTTWFVLGEQANLYEETEEVQHAEQCKLRP